MASILIITQRKQVRGHRLEVNKSIKGKIALPFPNARNIRVKPIGFVFNTASQKSSGSIERCSDTKWYNAPFLRKFVRSNDHMHIADISGLPQSGPSTK